jgi:hypothetical protein
MYLDFDGTLTNPADQPLNNNSQTIHWQDLGDCILPVWNIGYWTWSASTGGAFYGSHNGKFLELENNFVVSQAPTMTHKFSKLIESAATDYNYVWAWRK